MRIALPLLATVSLVSLTAGALAEPATPEGAEEIAQGYAEYLSKGVIDAQIVSVEPQGEAYLVTWDLQKAIDLVGPPAGAIKVESFSYLLTPGDSGVWTLKADHFPRVVFNVATDKGQTNGTFDFIGFHLDNVYDPEATDPLSSKLALDTLAAAFHIVDPSQNSDFKLGQNGVTVETHARPAADGAGVDVTVAQGVKGMTETILAPPEGGKGAPIQMNYTVGGAVGGSTLKGLRAEEIGELWKYVVAHMQDDGPPPKLKALLHSALPLWNALSASAEIHDMKFQLPFGEASLKTLGESIGLSGLTPKGAAEIGVKLEELSMTSPLLPPWSASFAPASIDLDVRATVDGLDKVAELALNDPNFGGKGDLSPQTQQQITALLLGGNPKVVLAPGHLKIPTLDLAFEGEASNASGAPAGHLKLTADGLDKTIALFTEIGKTQPDLGNVALGLTFVKGLATTGADGRLVWLVDATADGQVSVNGQPFPTGK